MSNEEKVKKQKLLASARWMYANRMKESGIYGEMIGMNFEGPPRSSVVEDVAIYFVETFLGLCFHYTRVARFCDMDMVEGMMDLLLKTGVFEFRDGFYWLNKRLCPEEFPLLSVEISKFDAFRAAVLERVHSFIWHCLSLTSDTFFPEEEHGAPLTYLQTPVWAGSIFADKECTDKDIPDDVSIFFVETCVGVIEVGLGSCPPSETVTPFALVIPPSMFREDTIGKSRPTFFTSLSNYILQANSHPDIKGRVVCLAEQANTVRFLLRSYATDVDTEQEFVDEDILARPDILEKAKTFARISRKFLVGQGTGHIFRRMLSEDPVIPLNKENGFTVELPSGKNDGCSVVIRYTSEMLVFYNRTHELRGVPLESLDPIAVIEGNYLLRDQLICGMPQMEDMVPVTFNPPPFGVTFLDRNGFIIWAYSVGFVVEPPPNLEWTKIPSVTHIIMTRSGHLNGAYSEAVFRNPGKYVIMTTRTIFEEWRNMCIHIRRKDPTNYCTFVCLPVIEPLMYGGCKWKFMYYMFSKPALSFHVEACSHALMYTCPLVADPEVYFKYTEISGANIAQNMYESIKTVDIHIMKVTYSSDRKNFLEVYKTLPELIKQKTYFLPATHEGKHIGESYDNVEMIQKMNAGRAKTGLENTVEFSASNFAGGELAATNMLQALCSTKLLQSLPPADIFQIFNSLVQKTVESDTILVCPGNHDEHHHSKLLDNCIDDHPHDDTLFIIVEGMAEMVLGEDVLTVFTFGDMFMQHSAGIAHVVSRTPLKVLSFSPKVLENLTLSSQRVLRSLHYQSFILNSIRKSRLFNSLSVEQNGVLSRCVSGEQVLEPGEHLIHAGDTLDKTFYVVKSGVLNVLNVNFETGESTVVAQLGEGEMVGEIASFLNKPRTADVIATEKSVVFRMEKDDFDLLMAQHPILHTTIGKLAMRRLTDTKHVQSHDSSPLPSPRYHMPKSPQ